MSDLDELPSPTERRRLRQQLAPLGIVGDRARCRIYHVDRMPAVLEENVEYRLDVQALAELGKVHQVGPSR